MGEIISHSIGWNGHTLIGYSVAIGIAYLVGATMVTVHPTASCPTSVTSSRSSPACGVSPPVTVTPAAWSWAARCHGLREAQETRDVTTSVERIAADKSANATAGEYAGYYVGRVAANKSAQDKEIPVIRFSCAC